MCNCNSFKLLFSEPDEIIVPKHLCLQDTGVTHAGDAAALAKLCKNVTELDLEMNALSDWNKVLILLSYQPLDKLCLFKVEVFFMINIY